MDEDGNIGITLIAEGALSANLFRSPDIFVNSKGLRSAPIISWVWWKTIATPTSSSRTTRSCFLVSNPCHSIQIPKWFEEVRVDDDVTCETILADVDDDFSLKFDPFNLLPALRNMENSNLKHYAACLAFLLQCFVLTACQTQKPVYDDTLGLTAIPVEPGALAGRFYLRGVTNHLADLSFLGTWESASEVFWLVERSYDEVTQSYSQVMDFCTAINYEFAGCHLNHSSNGL